MRRSLARFHLYRYQILPANRQFQGALFGARSVEELIGKKNDIVRDVLVTTKVLRGRGRDIATKLLKEHDDLLLFQLAANRSLQHETKDFRTEWIDNWPKVVLLVWNAPNKQLVAVQHRPNAFQDTNAAIRALFDTITPSLAAHALVAKWEPLFEQRKFWDLAKRYEGRIQELEFDLTTPNMANISGALPDNLREFAKNANAVTSSVGVKSGPTAALKVESGDSTLDGLVSYASEGGGEITIRIIGMKKKIRTSRTVREVACDEAVLSGSPDDVLRALKSLLP